MITDFPEVKVISYLGNGKTGTVYLTEAQTKDNSVRHIVTKVQRFSGDLTTKSEYARLLYFDKFAKLHPDKFMYLISSFVSSFVSPINTGIHSKIISSESKRSTHTPTLAVQRNISSKNEYVRPIDNLNSSYILNYLPKLDGTYASIKDKLSLFEEAHMLNQIYESLILMHNAGFRHRDISENNIMYKIDDQITTTTNTTPTTTINKYKWYIIDYATVYHKSFIPNEYDRDLEIYRPNDFTALIISVLKNKLYIQGIKIPKYRILANKIRNHNIYLNISQYDIDDKTLVTAMEIYNNYEYAKLVVLNPTKEQISIYPNRDLYLKILGGNKRELI
jgi:hypothetical protein